MIRTFDGSGDGAGLEVGIAVASWNQSITDRLLEGAMDRLEALGVEEVTVVRVPGALELPVAAKSLVEAGVDAVIAIGTVIKGDTDHYDIVVRESAAGIALVAAESGIPVTNAILAVHDLDQAVERAGRDDSNKGAEAAEAAVRTATALRGLEGR
jgi:6,7-dimethyl-8-ribityllumazine synthase